MQSLPLPYYNGRDLLRERWPRTEEITTTHEAEERALAPLLSVLDFPHVRVTAQAPWCSSAGGVILQRAARLGVPFDFATAATNESGASQDKTMKTLILPFTSSFLKLLSEMGVRGQPSK